MTGNSRTGLAVLLLLTVAFSAAPAKKMVAAGPLERVTKWLPYGHGDASLRFFFDQEGELEEYRYKSEGIVSLEHAVFSRCNTVFFLDVYLATGMGESVAENLPFAPIEMSYRLTPFAEYRRGEHIYRAGWNHACDHLIYKDNVSPWYWNEGAGMEPDVYYNRVFLGAGTATIRRQEQSERYFSKGAERSDRRQLSWYLETGWYVRSLFGLFEPDALNGGNDWSGDAKCELRWPVLLRKSFALTLNNQTAVLTESGGRTYWRERLELELLLGGGNYGASLFAGANPVDEHPRDSREGLWELGGRFFF